MLVSRRWMLVTAGAAGAMAVALAAATGLAEAVSFLLGALLGAGSWAMVTVRVKLMTSGAQEQRSGLRTLSGLLTIPYYLLVALALWATARYFRDEAPWLLAGYLVILISSALGIMVFTQRRRRPQVSDVNAE